MKYLFLRDEARDLRAQGYSYKEIAFRLGISKSTSFEWVKNIELSKAAIARLTMRVDDARERSGFTQHLSKLRKIAIIEQQEEIYLNSLANHNLGRLLCAMIYWCEGAKQDDHVRFTNSDPKLVRSFLKLFRSSFQLEEQKFRALLHVHDYHDEVVQRRFWSEITGIPLNQFQRSYLKPHTGNVKRSGYPGCIHINYYNASVARSLLALARIYMNSS